MEVERQEVDGVRVHSVPDIQWRVTKVWMSNGIGRYPTKIEPIDGASWGMPFVAENFVDARRRGLELVPCKDKGTIEKIEVELVP